MSCLKSDRRLLLRLGIASQLKTQACVIESKLARSAEVAAEEEEEETMGSNFPRKNGEEVGPEARRKLGPGGGKRRHYFPGERQLAWCLGNGRKRTGRRRKEK